MPNKIPKIIHYCWLSGEDKPAFIQKCISSWKKVMPDYEIWCWDTKRFDIHSVKFVEEAYNVKKWAFAADYIRLYALYNYGGIYLDSDVLVFQKFDKFLHNSAFTSIESYFYGKKENDYWIESAILGAEKGNLFIKECMEYYSNRNFILENGTYDQSIICHIIANIAEKKYGFKKYIFTDTPLYLKDNIMTLYPPYIFSHDKGDIRKKTCAIHMYKGSWRDEKGKENKYLSIIRKIGVTLFNEKNWGIIYFKIKKIAALFIKP